MKNNKLEDFVKPIRGNSSDVIKDWKDEDKISILHIDGDHSYNAVKADINNYTPHLMKNGILIVDDYDSIHADIQKAVAELLREGKFKTIYTVAEIPGLGFGSIALEKISH